VRLSLPLRRGADVLCSRRSTEESGSASRPRHGLSRWLVPLLRPSHLLGRNRFAQLHRRDSLLSAQGRSRCGVSGSPLVPGARASCCWRPHDRAPHSPSLLCSTTRWGPPGSRRVRAPALSEWRLHGALDAAGPSGPTSRCVRPRGDEPAPGQAVRAPCAPRMRPPRAVFAELDGSSRAGTGALMAAPCGSNTISRSSAGSGRSGTLAHIPVGESGCLPRNRASVSSVRGRCAMAASSSRKTAPSARRPRRIAGPVSCAPCSNQEGERPSRSAGCRSKALAVLRGSMPAALSSPPGRARPVRGCSADPRPPSTRRCPFRASCACSRRSKIRPRPKSRVRTCVPLAHLDARCRRLLATARARPDVACASVPLHPTLWRRRPYCLFAFSTIW